MDQFFHPNQRKWISPLTHLGRSMRELKSLVRVRKESLLVVDPPESTVANAASMPGPSSASQSFGTTFSGIKAEMGLDGKEYMGFEAGNLGMNDVVIEAESERLKEELDRAEKNKWMSSDEACEAAVAEVGGADFFDLSEKAALRLAERGIFVKALEEEDEEEAEDQQPGPIVEEEDDEEAENEQRPPNPIAEEEDNDDEEEIENEQQPGPIVEEEEDEEMDCDDEELEAISKEPCTSASMNDSFNGISIGIKEEPEEELPEMNELEGGDLGTSIEAFNDMFHPLGLKNEIDEEPEPDIDFEDENDNYASAADRFDHYMKARPDLLHSDSEDEPEAVNSSDEEDDTFIDAGAAKMRENVGSGDAPPPPPAPATHVSTSTMKEAKRSTLMKVKRGSGKNVPSTSLIVAGAGGGKGISGGANGNSYEQSFPGASKTEQDAVSDFSRFTEWVFAQTKKNDEEQRNKITPDVMKKLNLSEKDVSHFLRNTSATLACVKGEVYRDEPVMKSSSMPLLGPPILPPSSTDLQSLAVFITHGEDPSCFPWKSINVQQQINDDFANDQFLKRLEQQKIDLADPAMKSELVNKEEDFLVQLLVYQATDPEDVLPDEVKLRQRSYNTGAVTVPSGSRRNIGRPCATDTRSYSKAALSRFVEPKPAYELHVLGSQTVRDLMNAIHCENDFVYMSEVAHPNDFVEDPNQFAKAKFPSSVILIHETIYSSPDHDATQYHTLVNDWAKKPPKKRIGPFKSGSWDVPLKDLELRFGFPYVYIHLGGCEHIIVFTKARLLHVEDNHLLREYPKIHGMTRFKSVYCRVDNEYLARWAVLDSKEFPENPMLLCTECVLMYCFDKQKKRQCKFRLFPFTQIANII